MQPDDLSDVCRDYGLADVERLAGSFRIRHTLAEMGAAR
jgi:isocitrate lyase